MVVRDLEEGILGISTIKEKDTVINTGTFLIVATLKDRISKQETLNEITTEIRKLKQNLYSYLFMHNTFCRRGKKHY